MPEREPEQKSSGKNRSSDWLLFAEDVEVHLLVGLLFVAQPVDVVVEEVLLVSERHFDVEIRGGDLHGEGLKRFEKLHRNKNITA